MTLTVHEIQERVTKIGVAGDADSEAGHIGEDQLYLDTLQAIADGAPNAADLARAALAAQECDFTRWYA